MNSLAIQDLSPEADEELYAKVKEAIRTAAGGDLVSSNLALTVFIQGLLLCAAFGVSEEWFHGMVADAFATGAMQDMVGRARLVGANNLPLMPQASE